MIHTIASVGKLELEQTSLLKFIVTITNVVEFAICSNSLLWASFSGPHCLWRRPCSPGDPIPQRKCAWLLSTYLKEGEKQKEVLEELEAKDDDEKESEVDGEVEERVTQRAHETWL